jgi:hypothetical protein
VAQRHLRLHVPAAADLERSRGRAVRSATAGVGTDVNLLRGSWYSVVYYEGERARGFSSGQLIRHDSSGEGALMFDVPGERYSRSVSMSEIISILSARRRPIPLGFRASREPSHS